MYAQGVGGLGAPIHLWLRSRWRGRIEYIPQWRNLARSVSSCHYYMFQEYSACVTRGLFFSISGASWTLPSNLPTSTSAPEGASDPLDLFHFLICPLPQLAMLWPLLYGKQSSPWQPYWSWSATFWVNHKSTWEILVLLHATQLRQFLRGGSNLQHSLCPNMPNLSPLLWPVHVGLQTPCGVVSFLRT